jgi:hypothetical protein
MLISIARGDQEIGEWPEEQVRAFYRDGQLLGTDYYWHEGMMAWQPLRDLMKPALPSVSAAQVDAQADIATAPRPPPLPEPVAPQKLGRNWKAESFGCLRFLTGILAYIVAFGVTKTYLLNDRELMTGVFYGAVAGFACGLVPLVVAKRKGFPCQRYFLICGAGGAVGGLILAVPLSIGLTIYVCLKKPKGRP